MAKRGSKLAKKAKKKGVAHSKMKNIQTLKRIKNKEFTPAERKARKEARREKRKMTYAELRARKLKELQRKVEFEDENELHPLSTEITGDDMISMLEPEDLKYLMEQNQDNDEEEGQQNKTEAEEGEEEKPFELEERSFHPFGNDIKSLLPFKTKSGIVERYTSEKSKGKLRCFVNHQCASMVANPTISRETLAITATSPTCDESADQRQYLPVAALSQGNVDSANVIVWNKVLRQFIDHKVGL
ncbi:uncharacterized protein LOC135208367 [Macrobrachium nipponense]|uniref:uncharacterized protein LOC135208367 n=1 Tax=Macrobrachium nipponense TaxID=159736 RepID=UPI0030C7CEE5